MNRTLTYFFTLLLVLALGLVWACSKYSNGGNPLSPLPQGASPSSTSTLTPQLSATPTITPSATPNGFTVSTVVDYPSVNQSGVNWALVDPLGNTVGSATTPNEITFQSGYNGVYHAVIPAQGVYQYSSTPVTLLSLGSYAATFNSQASLQVEPALSSFSSTLGGQNPLTVTYSQTGNLNIPVTLQAGGLPSAFSLSATSVSLPVNGASAALTVTHNACYGDGVTLSLTAVDKNNGTAASLAYPIALGYLIPVTFTGQWQDDGYVCGGSNELNILQVVLEDGSESCGATYVMSVTGASPQTFTNTNNVGSFGYCTSPNSYSYQVTFPDGSTQSGPVTLGPGTGSLFIVSQGYY